MRATFFDWSAARDALPDVLEGFWLNVRLFLLAEPLILVLGLAVAAARVSTSPLLLPVRLSPSATPTSSAGCPRSSSSSWSASGCRRSACRGVTSSLFWLALVALVLSYGAYVAEVFRAGIESVHPSQVASATALGLSHARRRCATSSYPRPCAGCCRRCSTTSSRCRRTPRWSPRSASSTPSAPPRTSRTTRSTSRRTSSPRRCSSRLTVPLARFTDWVGRRAMAAREGRGPMSEPVLRVEGLRKTYGDKVVLVGRRPHRRARTTWCASSARPGSGKSTLLRCIDLLETTDDGTIWFEGEDVSDPRVDARAVRQADRGSSSRPTTSSRT